jgi:site-specific recombinase XerD
MTQARWLVRFTRAELPVPRELLSFAVEVPGDWAGWLRQEDIPPGTPFLLSPSFEYDVTLNSFFLRAQMVGAPRRTQEAYARDIAAFLTFLWRSRGGRSWRDASEDDHLAYLIWRRRDPNGPRVDGATWDREVATVNQFYRWALRAGHVSALPIPQASRRPAPVEAGRVQPRNLDEHRPATYSHDAARERVKWLPPTSYRLWRDVGVRGLGADGMLDPRFRGRWAARNATFCDLMVRTGLRLSEQAALTVFEVPEDCGQGGYQRFWLPAAIAKGGSARWVYVPGSLLVDLATYAEIDRAAVVADAQAAGRYRSWRRPLVVEDPSKPVAVEVAGGLRHRVKVVHLDDEERSRLLIDGPDRLQPAAFWLSEHGLPLTVSSWKQMFQDANARCRTAGVRLRCHAHMLRHMFAVVTLEQLQRGHIAALAELTPEQRGHYTRIFGDPLDWVRRRLGHRSLTSTMIYLHALGELEMHTRMALVPDHWEDPRDCPAAIDGADSIPAQDA